MSNVSPRKKMSGWKKSFIIWNALGLFFLIMGIVSAGSTASDCAGEYMDACQAGASVGGGLIVMAALFITALGDGILAVAYSIFRKREPVIVYQAPPQPVDA